MKQWFSMKELADHQLPELPTTVQGLLKLANRENWESQQRMGKGGGWEYHISNLPSEARKALEAQQIEALMPRLHERKQVAIKTASAHQKGLTERQRTVADARTTVICAVDGLKTNGVTQKAAITALLAQAISGQLDVINPVLDAALRLAKDPRGRSKSSYPSERSLLRWLGTETKALAPKSKREVIIPAWASDFLKCWQRPEKPSIEHAYRQLTTRYSDADKADDLPSIHQVRRFITKMGNVSKQRGRMGAREIKNILAFYRRDFADLVAGEVYSADGHSFDGEVQHPLHGRAFRPEVTTFIDIATRRAVGVSVDLAESSIAVLDALISSCTQAIPSIIYVDNGGGYENALLKDEALGVLARLGATMTHSVAYNSQARGAIERVHQTLWVDGAKELPSFVGADMDKEARHENFKLSRKAIKHGGALPLMGWQDFMDWVNQRVDWYNARPHSSLPKITDAQGKRRHMSPDDLWQQHIDNGWEPDLLSPSETADVFRPRVERKVNRCEIRLMTNIYFSKALTEWHGEQVQVAFDIHDPQEVWVYEPEHGRLICAAEVDGNRQAYFPKSFRQMAAERRAKAKIKRADLKKEEALLELHGRPALEQDNGFQLPGIGSLTEVLANRPSMFDAQAEVEEAVYTPVAEAAPSRATEFELMSPAERFELFETYRSGQKAIPDSHQKWFSRYGNSRECQAFTRRAG